MQVLRRSCNSKAPIWLQVNREEVLARKLVPIISSIILTYGAEHLSNFEKFDIEKNNKDVRFMVIAMIVMITATTKNLLIILQQTNKRTSADESY